MLIEKSLMYAAIALYIAGLGCARWRLLRFAVAGAFALHTVAIAIRWVAVGHPPLFGTYENTSATAWFMAATVLIVLFRYTGAEKTAFITLVTAPFLMIYGMTFNLARVPLTISERSLWVDFHSLFAGISYGGFVLAMAAGLLGLLKKGAELDDRVGFRGLLWGFGGQSLTLFTGVVYSYLLFGRMWQWDPMQTYTLMAWLLYALLIHLRLFYRWEMSRILALSLGAFIVVALSYWTLIYLPPGATFHTFDIDSRTHFIF
ncbi:MAG: cytochrome c biogenesis protein [Nitrospirota bacterium]|nr:cytochrome c biogenesis protein [Nitrospirota bacterium]